MDNKNYQNILKNKKIELINSLNLLGNNITNKLKEKNNIIKNINEKLNSNDLDYIAKYKTEKNKELDILKLELNNILKDIDNIITNIVVK